MSTVNNETRRTRLNLARKQAWRHAKLAMEFQTDVLRNNSIAMAHMWAAVADAYKTGDPNADKADE